MSFDWTSNGAYDYPNNHWIQSKNENGFFDDSIRINSYSNIINTIDSNSNSTSKFIIQKEATWNWIDLLTVDETGNTNILQNLTVWGNVWIWTTNPSSTLDVNWTLKATSIMEWWTLLEDKYQEEIVNTACDNGIKTINDNWTVTCATGWSSKAPDEVFVLWAESKLFWDYCMKKNVQTLCWDADWCTIKIIITNTNRCSKFWLWSCADSDDVRTANYYIAFEDELLSKKSRNWINWYTSGYWIFSWVTWTSTSNAILEVSGGKKKDDLASIYNNKIWRCSNNANYNNHWSAESNPYDLWFISNTHKATRFIISD